MVEIQVKKGAVNIKGLAGKDKAELQGFLTYRDTSGQFRKQKGGKIKFNSKAAKNVRFYRLNKSMFTTRDGFLPEIEQWFQDRKTPYKLTIEREDTVWMLKTWTKKDLRGYFNPDFPYVNHQIRALMQMLKTNRGLIKVPTSGGKTEIISAYLRSTDMSAVVIADSTLLVEQTAERLQADGIDAQVFHGTKKNYGRVVCATWQSLKAFDRTGYDCFICDEAHIASGTTIQRYLANNYFQFCFGFSASPDMQGAVKFAKLRQFFGGIIAEVYVGELIENEVVTPPSIRFVYTNCPRTENWEDAYEYGIIKNPDRNKTIIRIARQYENALILISRIEHGELLKDLMPEAELLHGSHKLEDREKAVERFKKEELKYIIASNIFKQGISINNIQCLVNAAGGKSGKDNIQKVGRAMRKSEGKDKAWIIDFSDWGNKWTRGHARERRKIYIDAGYTDIKEKT